MTDSYILYLQETNLQLTEVICSEHQNHSDSTDFLTMIPLIMPQNFLTTFDKINLWFAIISLSLNLNKINKIILYSKIKYKN